jgi:hypothetical protein
MNKRLLVVVGALIASTLLSGCWLMREASWTKDKVDPGEKTTLRVGLFPANEKENDRFFLGFAFKGENVQFGPAKFDATGELGKPKKMIRDAALRDVIADDDLCGDQLPGEPSFVFRTQNNVTDDTRKFIEATLRARTPRSADGGGAGGFLVTGGWRDDGDGIPEDPDLSDDELACTGVSQSAFVIKGGGATAARVDVSDFLR